MSAQLRVRTNRKWYQFWKPKYRMETPYEAIRREIFYLMVEDLQEGIDDGKELMMGRSERAKSVVKKKQLQLLNKYIIHKVLDDKLIEFHTPTARQEIKALIVQERRKAKIEEVSELLEFISYDEGFEPTRQVLQDRIAELKGESNE